MNYTALTGRMTGGVPLRLPLARADSLDLGSQVHYWHYQQAHRSHLTSGDNPRSCSQGMSAPPAWITNRASR